jgi:hypothetical protein
MRFAEDDLGRTEALNKFENIILVSLGTVEFPGTDIKKGNAIIILTNK